MNGTKNEPPLTNDDEAFRMIQKAQQQYANFLKRMTSEVRNVSEEGPADPTCSWDRQANMVTREIESKRSAQSKVFPMLEEIDDGNSCQ
jgi:hypothetical protein